MSFDVNSIPGWKIKKIKEAYIKLYCKVYSEAKALPNPYPEKILDKIVEDKFGEAINRNKQEQNLSDEDISSFQDLLKALSQEWKKEIEGAEIKRLKTQWEKGCNQNKKWWQFWKPKYTESFDSIIEKLKQFRDLQITKEELFKKIPKVPSPGFKPVVVKNCHLSNLLLCYKEGSISEQALLKWVNTIWFTDWFTYHDEHSDCIASIMTELEEIDEEGKELTPIKVEKYLNA